MKVPDFSFSPRGQLICWLGLALRARAISGNATFKTVLSRLISNRVMQRTDSVAHRR